MAVILYHINWYYLFNNKNPIYHDGDFLTIHLYLAGILTVFRLGRFIIQCRITLKQGVEQ